MIVKKRKGISTFIATLLLLLLAVAAGVIIYAYVMGYLGGFGNPNTMGALSIDSMGLCTVDGVPTNAVIGDGVVYLRNIGKVALTLDKVYIDGKETADFSLAYPTGTSLLENEIAPLILEKINWGTTAKTYEVKIICKDNTQLTFNIKAG